MSTRWIAVAAVLCDLVVARTGPAVGLPWIGVAGVVLAVGLGAVALAPSESSLRSVGTLAALVNLFLFCSLAFFALCMRVDSHGQLAVGGAFALAAVASFAAALLDLALVLRADFLPRRRSRVPVGAIAVVGALSALGAALCTWPGYSAKLELTIAAVLAIASWAPTERRWYTTAVIVAPLQCVLALGAWMVLVLVALPDSSPGASIDLWLRAGLSTIAAAASCLMTMRADELATPIPRASART
jgi:hypothetical protein